MKYLASTFSPMMLDQAQWAGCEVVQVELGDIPDKLESIVSHEVTAKVLTALLQEPVAFNRVNVSLKKGDILYAVIPGFRASEAREFTHEEVSAAGWRCFQITVD